MNAPRRLHDAGQSIWLDNLTRGLLESGGLRRYIDELSVTGLTSNPTIFDHAIRSGRDYDAGIREKLAVSLAGEGLFFELALEDLTQAADLFRPIHEATNRVDGWVSLELSPTLAYDTKGSVVAAKELHARARRPNLFIKIPGTREGGPAIEEAIFAGVPVNVTLLFSREQYLAAAEAYMRGLERRVAAGLNAHVPSVASLFVSRWDVAVADRAPPALRGRLGIAMAKRTYRAYRELLASDRWLRLLNRGARSQRLLWASTGTKDPLGVRRTLRRLPRRPTHREYHAGEDAPRPRRSRRDRRYAAPRRRGRRGGDRRLPSGGHRCRHALRDVASRRRRGVRQVVGGSSRLHRRKVGDTAEGGLSMVIRRFRRLAAR